MDSSIRAAPLNTLQDDDDAPSASRSASECVRQRMCPPDPPRASHICLTVYGAPVRHSKPGRRCVTPAKRSPMTPVVRPTDDLFSRRAPQVPGGSGCAARAARRLRRRRPALTSDAAAARDIRSLAAPKPAPSGRVSARGAQPPGAARRPKPPRSRSRDGATGRLPGERTAHQNSRVPAAALGPALRATPVNRKRFCDVMW